MGVMVDLGGIGYMLIGNGIFWSGFGWGFLCLIGRERISGREGIMSKNVV